MKASVAKRHARARGKKHDVGAASLANLRPWTKGRSGNPEGRPPRVKVDVFADDVLKQRVIGSDVGLPLREVIPRCVGRAADGMRARAMLMLRGRVRVGLAREMLRFVAGL